MSRILIVEDEESIAELEKDYLELSGFEVEIENNGRVGLERALQEEFDLFILDLMLPGVDGFETVSYTHLDVYKRQYTTCPFAPAQSSWRSLPGGIWRTAIWPMRIWR